MIGDNIKRILKRKHWSQKKLAEKVGWSENAVNAWIKGKTVPNAYAMLDIAKALKVSVLEIYGEEK